MIKRFSQSISQICDDAFEDLEKTTEKDAEGFIGFESVHLTSKIFSNVIIESFVGGQIRDIKTDGLPHYIFVQKLFQNGMLQAREFLAQMFGAKYLDLGLWASHRDMNRRIKLNRSWAKSYIEERMEITKKEIAEGKLTKKSAENIVAALLLENPHYTVD